MLTLQIYLASVCVIALVLFAIVCWLIARDGDSDKYGFPKSRKKK